MTQSRWRMRVQDGAEMPAGPVAKIRKITNATVKVSCVSASSLRPMKTSATTTVRCTIHRIVTTRGYA